MKIIKFQLPFSLLAAATAQAELQTVETPFWQVSIPAQQELVVRPLDPAGLRKACATYEGWIRELGPRPRRDEVEEMRSVSTTPGHPSLPYVNTGFVVSAEPSRARVEAGIAKANRATRGPAPVPLYYTSLSSLRIRNLGTSPSLSISAPTSSMTAVSVRVGLLSRPIRSSGADFWGSEEHLGRPHIAFEGLDSACDFLSGRGAIELEAGAEALIPESTAGLLSSFYRDFAQLSLRALNSRKSPAGRAALVGYWSGERLDQFSNGNESEALRFLGNLIERFFHADMSPNQLWYRASDSSAPTLLVPHWGSSRIQLLLTAETN